MLGLQYSAISRYQSHRNWTLRYWPWDCTLRALLPCNQNQVCEADFSTLKYKGKIQMQLNTSANEQWTERKKRD